jgi:hypothetical protein
MWYYCLYACTHPESGSEIWASRGCITGVRLKGRKGLLAIYKTTGKGGGIQGWCHGGAWKGVHAGFRKQMLGSDLH